MFFSNLDVYVEYQSPEKRVNTAKTVIVSLKTKFNFISNIQDGSLAQFCKFQCEKNNKGIFPFIK